MIAIIDYGLGNLASVRNAFRAAKAEVTVSSDPAVIRQASGVVLPGVGAAGAGMERLRSRGLDAVVREVVAGEQPLLGICLGMQLFFDRSQEGNVACLGLIPGTVRLLRGEVKIPHIGWNQVAVQSEAPLWRGLQAAPKSGPRRADKSGPYFYFVHSYICEPLEPADVAGTTEHGEQFCSAVVRGRIWGTQFHPERSGQTGLQLIKNFVEWCSAKPQDSGHGFV